MSEVTTTGTDAGTLETNVAEIAVTPSQPTTILTGPVPQAVAVEAPVAEFAPPPTPQNIASEGPTDGAVETPPPSPALGIENNSIAETPADPAINELEPESGFASLGLSADLLRAVHEAGYRTPTPIQAEGIPYVMKRRDIIGIAQTGTGKTASFTLPMIELLARGRAKARMPRSLILEPTRELAAQVAESFEKYGKFNKLSMALLIGGVSFEDQNKKLDRGVDVLIATPGRLMDHFERGRLMLSQVQILVIDEADRMLDMGFIPDVEKICKLLPFTRQTLFYSATMPVEIRRLTEQFLSNPVRVEVTRPAMTADNIKQEIVEVPNDEWAKREALRLLVREAGAITNAIVFCNKKRTVDIVAKSLLKHGFNAAPLHGDLDQSLRTKTLDGFRSGEVTILVASDVAARGLDIPACSHIFNFDVPYHPDDYVHRIGRTGRAGRNGEAYMLATSLDGKCVEAIEKLTKFVIPRRKLEGLAEQVRARPPRDKSREDRGRGGRDRDRGRRGDHREHPVKPHGQVASMEPVKAEHTPMIEQSAAPMAAAPKPERRPEPARQHDRQPERQHERKPEHRNRPDHRNDHRPKPDTGPKPEPVHYAEVMRNKPSNQQRVEVTPVDASQLPAFLLRPVKLPKVVEKVKPAEKPVAAAKPIVAETPKVAEKKPRAPRKRRPKPEVPAVE